jgi:glutamine amidotransferase
MRVVVIDYGSGNLRSAAKALERAGGEAGLAADIIVTDRAEDVRRADRIVLPGVGAFADCRNGLFALDGMVEALTEAVRQNARPFLGICVGLQLMAERGLEHGVTPGFGWIKGEVRAIEPSDPAFKVPHMGWNTLEQLNPHPVLDDIKTGPDGLHAYFVHSYHLAAERREDIVATCDYAQTITAMIARDNMVGTQFHPEKSQKLGLALLANFLKWSP